MSVIKKSLSLCRQRNNYFISQWNRRNIFTAIGYRNFASETKEQTTETELTETEKKLNAEIEKLNGDIKVLTAKNEELVDKYKRSLADSENLRVRLMKQIDDARQFGIQGFCKDLIEVSDILSQATESVPSDELAGNVHLKNLYEGLSMTQAQLMQVFKRHGLEQVNPINEKFNPNYHEALFQQENDKVEPNTVINVSKIGYKLRERCIRPAMVGVSRK